MDVSTLSFLEPIFQCGQTQKFCFSILKVIFNTECLNSRSEWGGMFVTTDVDSHCHHEQCLIKQNSTFVFAHSSFLHSLFLKTFMQTFLSPSRFAPL